MYYSATSYDVASRILHLSTTLLLCVGSFCLQPDIQLVTKELGIKMA